MLPLIAAAIAAGTIRAGVGAIQANQQKQRTKGFVNANYRLAKDRLDRSQGAARQGIAESLNERGLAQGGGVSASPIHAAMVEKGHERTQMTAQGAGAVASTIGEAETRDANEEMALEQTDLTQQRDQALTQNKADYNNALLNSGVAGVQTGMSVYGAGKDLGAMNAAKGTATASMDRSKIHSMMLSGSAYDGVHPNDPLGDPTSAWSTQPRGSKLADPMQSNGSFNVFPG